MGKSCFFEGYESMFGRCTLLIRAAWHALIGKVVMPIDLLGDEPFSAAVRKKPVSPKGDTGIESPLSNDDAIDSI